MLIGGSGRRCRMWSNVMCFCSVEILPLSEMLLHSVNIYQTRGGIVGVGGQKGQKH